MGSTAERMRKPSQAARKRKPKNGPKDCGFEQFGWYPLELLESDPFRVLSPNSRRLLDRLMIEHIHQGGVENGLLVATHEQLREYGLTASSIREAIDECLAFGLIRMKQGGRWAGSNRPNLYRLTWIGWVDGEGSSQFPTNEWKGVTVESITAWRDTRKAQRAAKRGRKRRRKGASRPALAPNSLPSTQRSCRAGLGDCGAGLATSQIAAPSP